MVDQRKLMIEKVKLLIRNSLPMDKDEFLVDVQIETGLSEKKAQEYLRLLYKKKYFTERDVNGLMVLERVDTNADKEIQNQNS